jgi:hypothetical protein
MGRTVDQIGINTLIGGTYNTTATDAQGFSIVAGGTGFTVAKLRELRAYYDDLEVEDQICILTSGAGKESLLANEETTSSDYAAVKALVHGQFDDFMGFKFLTVGARRLEGGLGGSGVLAYAYTQSSLGIASGIDERLSVDWVAERSSWLSNGMLKCGSVIIDPEGTAKIAYV